MKILKILNRKYENTSHAKIVFPETTDPKSVNLSFFLIFFYFKKRNVVLTFQYTAIQKHNAKSTKKSYSGINLL